MPYLINKGEIVMKSYVVFLVSCMLLSAASKAQATKSADEILKQAYSAAAKEKKNVFVIFHASWCGWRKKMDTAMNDQSVKIFLRITM
jgi:thioredoxin-related protein